MANRDIRLPVEFFAHPKTRKLRRLGGDPAVLGLLQLWTWAAQNRWKDGDLSDYSPREIASLAGWSGEKDFVTIAESCGFLDRLPNGGFRLHQWETHQEYCATTDARIAKAKKAVQARERQRVVQLRNTK